MMPPTVRSRTHSRTLESGKQPYKAKRTLRIDSSLQSDFRQTEQHSETFFPTTSEPWRPLCTVEAVLLGMKERKGLKPGSILTCPSSSLKDWHTLVLNLVWKSRLHWKFHCNTFIRIQLRGTLYLLKRKEPAWPTLRILALRKWVHEDHRIRKVFSDTSLGSREKTLPLKKKIQGPRTHPLDNCQCGHLEQNRQNWIQPSPELPSARFKAACLPSNSA